jgi:hypothetical protein
MRRGLKVMLYTLSLSLKRRFLVEYPGFISPLSCTPNKIRLENFSLHLHALLHRFTWFVTEIDLFPIGQRCQGTEGHIFSPLISGYLLGTNSSSSTVGRACDYDYFRQHGRAHPLIGCPRLLLFSDKIQQPSSARCCSFLY